MGQQSKTNNASEVRGGCTFRSTRGRYLYYGRERAGDAQFPHPDDTRGDAHRRGTANDEQSDTCPMPICDALHPRETASEDIQIIVYMSDHSLYTIYTRALSLGLSLLAVVRKTSVWKRRRDRERQILHSTRTHSIYIYIYIYIYRLYYYRTVSASPRGSHTPTNSGRSLRATKWRRTIESIFYVAVSAFPSPAVSL